MPAPTGGDGIGRGLEEIFLPPIGILVTVALMNELVGPVAAGAVYLGLTVVVFLGILHAARYWNVRYMAGFLLSAVVLFGLAPSVVSDLVHPAVGVLGTVLGLFFLVVMVALFVEKAGLDDVLGGL